MAIKTKDELLLAIKAKIGDDAGDESLTLLEDLSDTMTDLETKAKGDGKDWKAEAERIDAEWRQKYRDRFFGKEPENPDPDPAPDSGVNMSFEDLFKGEE